MANLAQNLPPGTSFRTQPDGWTRTYGPPGRNLIVAREGAAVDLIEVGSTIAAVTDSGSTPVLHSAITPLNLPYVNKFLVGTGREVKKNWRTGLYETRRTTAGTTRKERRAAARLAAATQHTTSTVDETVTAKPVAYVPPKVAEAESKGATITVSGDETSPLAKVPGVEFMAKRPSKKAGAGYSDVGGIILPNDQLEELQDAWDLAQQGEVSATLITGPAGTAKTMVVRGFAATLGVPYLKIDAGSVRTVDDWSGTLRQDPATKTWDHRWSPFALALRAGVPMVLHVDEITRTDTPAALNAFMGLLDETGSMLVPDANTVLRMPKGILLVATANIGPEFVGTLPLDGAVRQRFPFGFRMAPPPVGQEAKLLVRRTGVTEDVAVRLVRLAVEQRKHRDDAQAYPSGAVISTRVLIAAARKIAKGRDPRKALARTLATQFDQGDDPAISVLIDSQFPKGYQPDGSIHIEDDPEEGAVVGAQIVTERHYFVGVSNSSPCGWTFSNGTECRRANTDPIHLQ